MKRQQTEEEPQQGNTKSLVIHGDVSWVRRVTGRVGGGRVPLSCCVPQTEQSSNQNTIHHPASHKCDMTGETVPCQGSEIQKECVGWGKA